jgi:hypothetical protein
VSQIVKKAHEFFSESNQTMTESPVHEEMIALAFEEDCPDDLGGILEVIDAASDSSGPLRWTDDFGMIDDPEDTSTGSSGAQLIADSSVC